MTSARGARLAIAAGLAGLCVLAAPGCTSEAEKLERHLQRAAEKTEEGDYRAALINLRQALKLDPTNAQINLQIAQLYDAMGQPPDAAFFYGEAYRLDPSLTQAALHQVPFFYESDPDTAQSRIEEVLEREPDNALAYVRSAELALVRVVVDAALAAALTAVELDPENVLHHRTLGTVYRAMIREKKLRRQELEDSLFQAALAAFETAFELQGGGWFDRREMALIYAEWDGHQEDARASWREAFEVAREREAPAGMRVVAAAAFQYARSIRDRDFMRWALERRLEVDPQRMASWMGLAQLAEAEDGSGDAVWRRALEQRPDDPLIHTGYAAFLGRVDRASEAIAHLEAVPDAIVASPEVLAILVELYLAEGRLDAAAEPAARLGREHPEHELAGVVQARLDLAAGRVDEAAERLRALSTQSERSEVFRLLARAERQLGDTRAARAAASRALELHPAPGPPLYQQVAGIQGAMGDWAAVLETLAEMRRSQLPAGIGERILLVRAFYETGRQQRARRALERLLAEPGPPVGAVVLFGHYEANHEPARARSLMEAALAAHPEERMGLVRLLALLELSQGDPGRALERIAGAGSPETLPTELRILRARALARLGRLEEAEVDARVVFQAKPRPQTSARVLAMILEAQGKRDEAIASLERAQREGTLTAPDLWLLGRLQLENGDLERSRAALEEAVAASPALHAARNDLAFVLAESGHDLERALDLAREAKAALPENPAVADTLGYVYYRRGLLEPAVSEFRSAIALAKIQGELPADFPYHLGLALQALGRNAEALRAYEEALSIEPDHEGAARGRATLTTSAAPGAGR